MLVGTDLSGTDRLENEAFIIIAGTYYSNRRHGPAYGELYRYDQIISVDGQKFFNLKKLNNHLQDKDKAEFIVRRIEYFDGTRYVVDVTKIIEIEEVGFLTF